MVHAGFRRRALGRIRPELHRPAGQPARRPVRLDRLPLDRRPQPGERRQIGSARSCARQWQIAGDLFHRRAIAGLQFHQQHRLGAARPAEAGVLGNRPDGPGQLRARRDVLRRADSGHRQRGQSSQRAPLPVQPGAAATPERRGSGPGRKKQRSALFHVFRFRQTAGRRREHNRAGAGNPAVRLQRHCPGGRRLAGVCLFGNQRHHRPAGGWLLQRSGVSPPDQRHAQPPGVRVPGCVQPIRAGFVCGRRCGRPEGRRPGNLADTAGGRNPDLRSGRPRCEVSDRQGHPGQYIRRVRDLDQGGGATGKPDHSAQLRPRRLGQPVVSHSAHRSPAELPAGADHRADP